LQGYIPHQQDAWQYTLAALESYVAKALASPVALDEVFLTAAALLGLTERHVSPPARKLIGPYLKFAQLLGRHTAELHLALASEPEDVHFAPEPFSSLHQHSLYQSMRGLMIRVCRQLSRDLHGLAAPVREEAERLLDLQDELLQRFQAVLERKLTGWRIRCHGDYHLRQVLLTDQGVALIDFEGEPARLLWERQIKRCPLLDVASMLRSFHYAAYSTFFDRMDTQGASPCSDPALLESWMRFWCGWVSAAFLKTYLQRTAGMAFMPQTPEELRVLCDVYLLEKALYALGYELEHRPARVKIPLRGLLQLLESTRC
jgi:maltose alpha-D-glucosyltransferase/alpha-amylase